MTETNLVGKRLGQYDIIGVLGQGGMATVYRANQPSMDREVAIKVINEQIARQGEFGARFEREVRLISKLQHPHILPVYDFGNDNGLLYLVMRLVDNGMLETRMKQGRLPLSLILRWITEISSALTFSHSKGVIHRDLKPSNIMLDADDNTYLTDFGIAKQLESNTNLTQTGQIVGTPSYMAPEQWRGEELDARTDIYALGIMLYQMLTGTLPFKGDTPFALMYQHMDTPLPSPTLRNPLLPEAIKPVLEKAIAKVKEDRYADANQFAAAVNEALGSLSTGVIQRTGAALLVHTPERIVIVAQSADQAMAKRLHDRLMHSYGSERVASLITPTADPARSTTDFQTADTPVNQPGAAGVKITTNDIIVALIGSDWNRQLTADHHQLDDENDVTRQVLEIAVGSQSTRLIPVLLADASMPSSSTLPVSIQSIAAMPGFALSAANFEADVKLLIKEIGVKGLPVQAATVRSSHTLTTGGTRRWLIAASGAAGAVVVTVAVVVLGRAAFAVAPAAPTTIPTASITNTITAPPTASPVVAMVPTLIASSANLTVTIATSPGSVATAAVTALLTVAPITNPVTVAVTASLPATSTATSAPVVPAAITPTIEATLSPTPIPVTIASTLTPSASLTLTSTVSNTPQAISAVSTAVPARPSPTYDGPTLTIFRSGDALTLYVPGTTRIALTGVTIEAVNSQGQRLKAELDQYPAFIGLPFAKMPAPVCFHLENKQQVQPLPTICRQIPANQLFINKLTPADVIWFDEVAGETRSVLVTLNDQILGQCASDQTQCDIPLPKP